MQKSLGCSPVSSLRCSSGTERRRVVGRPCPPTKSPTNCYRRYRSISRLAGFQWKCLAGRERRTEARRLVDEGEARRLALTSPRQARDQTGARLPGRGRWLGGGPTDIASLRDRPDAPAGAPAGPEARQVFLSGCWV